MREHKIVVLGSMGSGKSTLVRAIAAGAVIDTDVHNSDRQGADKASTTVAMDYADIDLPNGDRLRLYGTPGQQRFDFLWPILLQGASGVVLLLDATRGTAIAELEAYLGVLLQHAAQVPAVIGVSRLDLAPQFDLEACAVRAGREGRWLPVVPLDARDREQGLCLMDVLMSEMEAGALVAAHG
ncbi:GTP-binding protein [Stenotrophomonas rhizophila]|jgi:signal recognition particle receptor subunit beta|uniref:ATP/GTP-binding protein n=1 Tax=Stenotrophomonas nematodicola TaxID=2656746 RepID=A0ABW7D0C9_9GAMM|nr:ATP/GTP-binding protein [Stenotrophomonas sp. BIGb0135]MCS4236927.1 signal recognition particle receptor subunit beta [Stenotrophomonas sp. BIGb0135]